MKIANLVDVPEPDQDFVSTNEQSFAEGAVGAYIRKKFNRKIWREG